MNQHCCHVMEAHAGELGEANTIVVYNEVFDEYALASTGDPNPKRTLEIRFCPFCGEKLPRDKRGQWYEALKQIGVDPDDTDSIPASFKSSKWWKSLDVWMKVKGRRPQMSLQALVLSTLVTGIGLGWWCDHRRLSGMVDSLEAELRLRNRDEARVLWALHSTKGYSPERIREMIYSAKQQRADSTTAWPDVNQ